MLLALSNAKQSYYRVVILWRSIDRPKSSYGDPTNDRLNVYPRAFYHLLDFVNCKASKSSSFVVAFFLSLFTQRCRLRIYL